MFIIKYLFILTGNRVVSDGGIHWIPSILGFATGIPSFSPLNV